MTHKILSLALVAISMISFSSAAQSPNSCGNISKKNALSRRRNAGMPNTAEKAHARRPVHSMVLNLRKPEKAQLGKLNEKRAEERRKEYRDQKEEKMRNDSIRGEKRRMEKRKYLDDVKKIIGSDNYILFLENIYINGNNGQGHDRGMKPGYHKNKMHGTKEGKGKKRIVADKACHQDARRSMPQKAVQAEL